MAQGEGGRRAGGEGERREVRDGFQPPRSKADAAAPAAPAAGAEDSAAGRGRVPRVKRLERPDRKKLEEAIAEVNAKSDGLHARIQTDIPANGTVCRDGWGFQEIKGLLDSKQQNRQSTSTEVQDARRSLAAVQAQFRTCLEEKKALRNELSMADDSSKRMREDARSLRDKLPFVKVEQIDEEIRKLEYKMSHSTLSLPEEKKLMQQTRDLTKSRDFVKDYNERMDKISQDESGRGAILERIKEKDDILNQLKAQENEQRDAIAAIRNKEQAQASDFPALLEEKNAKYEEITQLREQVKQLRAEFRQQEDVYYKQEKEWYAQQQEERKKAYEAREAYRKERERIRKEREKEYFVEPYTDEIIMCDQLTAYLSSVRGVGATQSTEEVTTSPAKVDIVAPEGVGSVIVSKRDRKDEDHLDGWFAGSGGGKKGKGKGKGPASSSQPAKPKSEKLSLSLDALTSFEKIKLATPSSTADVPGILELIKEKKVEYQKLQDKEREKRQAAEDEEAKGGGGAANPQQTSTSKTDGGADVPATLVNDVVANGAPDNDKSEAGEAAADADASEGEADDEAVPANGNAAGSAGVDDEVDEVPEATKAAASNDDEEEAEDNDSHQTAEEGSTETAAPGSQVAPAASQQAAEGGVDTEEDMQPEATDDDNKHEDEA
eukprot:SM000255S08764  [mRNA]  locus=s255:48935:52553:+ [translate_table: standard]